MQLVEQTIISKSDPRYAAIDAAAFAAKNLYNLALYEMRQSYIHEGISLSSAEVYHRVKHSEAYQALPRKVSNDILRHLEKAWRSFRAAMKAWYEEEPSKFLGRPQETSPRPYAQIPIGLVRLKTALSDRSICSSS